MRTTSMFWQSIILIFLNCLCAVYHIQCLFFFSCNKAVLFCPVWGSTKAIFKRTFPPIFSFWVTLIYLSQVCQALDSWHAICIFSHSLYRKKRKSSWFSHQGSVPGFGAISWLLRISLVSTKQSSKKDDGKSLRMGS